MRVLSSASPPTLSATSAALLGQLAWRPQTPYELTLAMRRNLRYFWPRAASHVYREVKRLTAHGWARVERGRTGRRPRSVYHITDAGRAALAGWLSAPPGEISLEHEPLLRVFLASGGSRRELLAAIRKARDDAAAMLEIGESLAREYLDRTHLFQAQVHVRALTFDYLYNWARLTVEWADRAEREVGRWDDLDLSPAKERRALRHLRQVLNGG